MATRSYKDAIDCLNSLQSNAATLDAIRASGGRSNTLAIPEMLDYLRGIGYRASDLNKLNVVHVTGTKGKGSTCAFVDSILRHAMPRWKVGLYTSPHLVAVRERIRIGGVPLSEEEFASYFFQVWDKLENDFVPVQETTPPKPGYFRFLTLLAYHVFLDKQVDATVLEVGVGGTYDSTNIVPKPIVTGVTALGIDHVNILGKTIAEIAWHKGGIYKEGVPAFTVPQPEEGLSVLQRRATELKASDFVVTSELPTLAEVQLGLAGAHQRQNALLAVNLCKAFIHTQTGQTLEDPLPEIFVEGLKKAKWPGRCQTLGDPEHPNITWFLDGAHTMESLGYCIQWFVTAGFRNDEREKRLLIFNCTNGRSGSNFLRSIVRTMQAQLHEQPPRQFFDYVIFCTNVTYADGGSKGDLTKVAAPPDEFQLMRDQRELKATWLDLVPDFPEGNIHVLPSIEHAVNCVKTLSQAASLNVLVTGSLYLVGGLIEVGKLSNVAL